MELFYQILEGLNYVVILLAALGLLPQLIFICFGWIKPRKFKKAREHHHIAAIISAHNEEAVIGSTMKGILESQEYPKDKFDVFVCADNCDDKTAEKALSAGAKAYTRFESDPKKKMASYVALFAFLLPIIVYVLGAMYVIYSFQSYLSIRLSRKELRKENEKGWGAGIFLSTPYMILHDVAITIGVLTSPGWKSISRNVIPVERENAEQE